MQHLRKHNRLTCSRILLDNHAAVQPNENGGVEAQCREGGVKGDVGGNLSKQLRLERTGRADAGVRSY